MSEQIIFKDNRTRMLVTSHRFVVGNTTYSIRQIVSVDVYNKGNVEPDRRTKVPHANRIIFGRYLLGGLIFFSFLASDISGVWLLAAIILGLVLYWFIRTYPTEQLVPGYTYTTYHLDVRLSNGPGYHFMGDAKLVYALGKALNKALAEGELTSLNLSPLS